MGAFVATSFLLRWRRGTTAIPRHAMYALTPKPTPGRFSAVRRIYMGRVWDMCLAQALVGQVKDSQCCGMIRSDRAPRLSIPVGWPEGQRPEFSFVDNKGRWHRRNRLQTKASVDDRSGDTRWTGTCGDKRWER